MSEVSKSRKIAINTCILYLRMFAILVINLIAVRLVLRALGAQDYGIYNVVAGIIALVGFIGTAMSSATQRFFSYAIGKKDETKQKEIFTASCFIFIIFSLITLLITEVIGLWLINNQLDIPVERLYVAKWVFHFSVFAFIFNILNIPFSAIIIANENMGAYAAITFGECFLKFLSAIILYYVFIDKLFLYGLSILISYFIVLSAYVIVALKKYRAICSFVRINDRTIFKSLISFSGWSLFGSAAGVFINQGNTILVNIFFGPIVNAARAISLQISSALIMFSSSFTTALRPPIVKSYAEDNDDYVNKLFGFGNKFIFFAMLMVCLPLFFEMETVLGLWLKDFDADTVLFSRLVIIYTIIMVLHDPITTIIQASGNIKWYYILTESFTLLCMPATYLVYKMGAPAYATFVIMCISIICAHCMRLFVLKKQFPSFDFHLYIKGFILPAIVITTITVSLILVLDYFVAMSPVRLLATIFLTVVVIILLVFTVALNRDEKQMIKNIFGSIIHRTK